MVEYDEKQKCYILHGIADTPITLDAETYEAACEEAQFIMDNFYQ